jgi:hypothetical protein
MLDRAHEDPALLDRRGRSRFDPVEVEEVGRLVDVVDDIVQRGGEREDVFPVERGDVLGIEELDQIARDPVAFVLDRFHVRLSHGRVRVLPEARLRFSRRFERVVACFYEQVVEGARAGNEVELHGGGMLTGREDVGVVDRAAAARVRFLRECPGT